ncbi:MAG: sulfite exporter TauE/SafE family protein [Bacteroidia bacterium]|nr:sulfite exporter TauE/SafE family protein [Bacteroidia bacterium]
MDNIIIPFFIFFLISTLYSSVGHAGASGYLAVMALLSFSPESIKPTSLILNIAVALIASIKFIKEGYFDKKIFYSFIITSLPMAYIGGYISIDSQSFKIFAGYFLLLSALLLFIKTYIKPIAKEPGKIKIIYGLVLGAGIGILSGLIGVGGGIFLSPIIIMANWTDVKKASGVSALFILCNSIAALMGHLTYFQKIDPNIIYWLIAVCIGGILGSHLGTNKFSNKLVTTLLFIVLISAGLKFIVSN